VVSLASGLVLIGRLFVLHGYEIRINLYLRWIPFIIVAWSIVSASQAGIKTKAAYYAIRCILGLLMGGFIP
jgi:hypothetical protein